MISLMEGGHVDIGQKILSIKKMFKVFFRVDVRSSFVNIVSIDSILRCCLSLMNVS